jgi:serine/threonine-protein kinase
MAAEARTRPANVSHSWAATSVDLQTEEGRAFLQERLALLGKMGLLLSLLFAGLIAIAGPGLVARTPTGALVQHANDFVFLALWASCARGRRGIAFLRGLDATFPAVTCVAAGFPAFLWPGRLPGLEWASLLVLTNGLFARAALIPSPPRRTLLIGLGAAVPMMAAAVYRDLRVEVEMGKAVLTMSSLLWSLCAIAITTVASAVVYGLQERVREVQQLGQYTLGEKLGEGGMGVVYRAHHALLRRPTAIKLLPAEKAGEQSIRRFEREVQITAQLSHPNTVAVYDYGRTPEGIFYYAMEYLEGTTLQKLVQDSGPQPPARVVHLLRQVAGALGEAHAAGLVHRDVKPANILLCERGGLRDVAKVVDFGLVRDLERGDRATLTDVNAIAGTPLYLAPEAITRPDQVDARSDLYALGAVGYFLVTGAQVFGGATLVEVCSHHLHSRPVAPAERLGRPIPAPLERLLLDCLEKDPERRPQTAQEMDQRLAACGVPAWTQEDARAWPQANARSLAELETLDKIDLASSGSLNTQG